MLWGSQMRAELNSLQNRPVSDDEWRSLELKAERVAGFRNGALSVFTVVLMVGAFWVGLQSAPLF
jgi:hypothetical protein